MSHHHLSIEERACIAMYLEKGISISEIGRLLQRNKSTISREIARNQNCQGKYFAIGAARKYHSRRRNCVKTNLLSDKVIYQEVYKRLDDFWSPEQIANTMPQEHQISTSTIYRGIKKKLFPKPYFEKLRRYGKYLNRNHQVKRKGYDFSEVRSIAQRPFEVLSRQEIGHWELDSVVLRPECGCHLATMVERKSRLVYVRKIPNKKAKTMADAVIAALRDLPASMVKTLTVDRGLEFTDWKRIERELGVKVYFCDPYKPYQRGSNENTNGLLRQFFPRRKILPPITDDHVAKVQELINNRPRKCLNWSSPYQVFRCI